MISAVRVSTAARSATGVELQAAKRRLAAAMACSACDAWAHATRPTTCVCRDGLSEMISSPVTTGLPGIAADEPSRRKEATTLTIEITGNESKVEKFIELMGNFGIKELARTGKIALRRN